MKRLILHLGHAKTATTYLQSVLHLNEEAFLKRGFWIPSNFEAFGSYNFQHLAATGQIFSGNLQSVFEAAINHDSEQVGQMMDYALQTKEENVVLSSELLFYYNWVVQEIVQRANAQNFRVDVVVYLARQDRAVIAGYQQSIRNHGAQGSVVQFLEEQRAQALFEYAAVIDSYAITSPNRVIVRTVRTAIPSGWQHLCGFPQSAAMSDGPGGAALSAQRPEYTPAAGMVRDAAGLQCSR